jgi:hypothetical protein
VPPDERPEWKGGDDMSTSIGTLERRAPVKLWPVVVALLAVTALAVYFTIADRDRREEASTVSETAANTASELRWTGLAEAITNTAANTPSEMRGGFVELVPDTVANTPSEIRGGFVEAQTSATSGQDGRRGVTPRVSDDASSGNPQIVVGGETDAQFHPLP